MEKEMIVVFSDRIGEDVKTRICMLMKQEIEDVDTKDMEICIILQNNRILLPLDEAICIDLEVQGMENAKIANQAEVVYIYREDKLEKIGMYV